MYAVHVVVEFKAVHAIKCFYILKHRYTLPEKYVISDPSNMNFLGAVTVISYISNLVQ